ncbi:hypothetical protein HYPSUDRAFT_59947 [Hypholoma sublateritium FD-334 SS-4]|uniref:Uncharacterized protein n=1 Tax=Hypholoma sublateritium (strain FD-334 SS-4) TaxID=945553 RepID=A0A0D2N293_HYPSF|nr:hypothetical protein HYPSUDRAFT_59947 [Hypholoma sublateritium FD-334 SS-4]
MAQLITSRAVTPSESGSGLVSSCESPTTSVYYTDDADSEMDESRPISEYHTNADSPLSSQEERGRGTGEQFEHPVRSSELSHEATSTESWSVSDAIDTAPTSYLPSRNILSRSTSSRPQYLERVHYREALTLELMNAVEAAMAVYDSILANDPEAQVKSALLSLYLLRLTTPPPTLSCDDLERRFCAVADAKNAVKLRQSATLADIGECIMFLDSKLRLYDKDRVFLKSASVDLQFIKGQATTNGHSINFLGLELYRSQTQKSINYVRLAYSYYCNTSTTLFELVGTMIPMWLVFVPSLDLFSASEFTEHKDITLYLARGTRFSIARLTPLRSCKLGLDLDRFMICHNYSNTYCQNTATVSDLKKNLKDGGTG